MKYNIWKKKEDLENIKEAAVEFEVRLSAKTRQQEKLDMVKERNFKR